MRAHHVLHVPAAVHELAGQPIEQRGVHRRLALGAEIVQHPAQARAEELLPQPVHHRARRERVLSRRRATRARSRRVSSRPSTLGCGKKVGQRGLHHFAAFIHPVAARQNAHRRASPWQLTETSTFGKRIVEVLAFLFRLRECVSLGRRRASSPSCGNRSATPAAPSACASPAAVFAMPDNSLGRLLVRIRCLRVRLQVPAARYFSTTTSASHFFWAAVEARCSPPPSVASSFASCCSCSGVATSMPSSRRPMIAS